LVHLAHILCCFKRLCHFKTYVPDLKEHDQSNEGHVQEVAAGESLVVFGEKDLFHFVEEEEEPEENEDYE